MAAGYALYRGQSKCSDLLLERRWPTESVIRPSGQLVESGKQIALMGAPNEARGSYKVFSKDLLPMCSFE